MQRAPRRGDFGFGRLALLVSLALGARGAEGAQGVRSAALADASAAASASTQRRHGAAFGLGMLRAKARRLGEGATSLGGRRAASGSLLSAAAQAAPAPAPMASPAGAPGPAPSPWGLLVLPLRPKLPPVTPATCAGLVGAIGARSCQWYDFGFDLGAGCACVVPSTAGCSPAPGAEGLGFTGNPIAASALNIPEMQGVQRMNCFYRQWAEDPLLPPGPLQTWQQASAEARVESYTSSANLRAQINAEMAAAPLWAATPMPWLKMYPTTPPPVYAPYPGPAPARGPAPGPAPHPVFLPGIVAAAPAAFPFAPWLLAPAPAPSPFGAPSPRGPAPAPAR